MSSSSKHTTATHTLAQQIMFTRDKRLVFRLVEFKGGVTDDN
jgi:hypothetical protein